MSLAVCQSIVALGASLTRLPPLSTDLQLILTLCLSALPGPVPHSWLLTAEDTNTVLRTHRHSQSFLTASTASRYKIGELSALRCRIVGDQFNRIPQYPPCLLRVLPPSIQYCVGWLTLKNIKIGFNSAGHPGPHPTFIRVYSHRPRFVRN